MTACQADPTTVSAPTPDFERVGRLIHDEVLQTLGVALLQAELCRRFWGRARDGQIVAELDGVISALDATATASRDAVDELRLVEAWCRQGRSATSADHARWARANLASDDDRPEPVVSADEIVQGLGDCLRQAELCRRLCQQGEEARTVGELGVLLER